MNSKVFSDWITGVNADMRRQGRHILLMLDNATSHGKEEDHQLSHVKVKFLPANTTSHLQPLDQGTIHAFKALYRRRQLTSLISKLEIASSFEGVGFKVSNQRDGDDGNDGIGNHGDDDNDDDDDVPLAVLVRELALQMADFD
ncbi:tigger transposable element-derived protein 6-like [Dreissena polymorpha]|uniref:tigger transposable element-derived protein 6-like n=1 Tax=Dreissena polymorpha TaxID=45954 RepID=UPI002263B81E|nr:tigger transposable element-derived protein 6-like [Dreissena polymorpha]